MEAEEEEELEVSATFCLPGANHPPSTSLFPPSCLLLLTHDRARTQSFSDDEEIGEDTTAKQAMAGIDIQVPLSKQHTTFSSCPLYAALLRAAPHAV